MGADARFGCLERLAGRFGRRRPSRLDLTGRHAKGLRRQGQGVEFFREFDQGFVAASPHIGNDRAHAIGNVRLGFALFCKKGLEARLEIGIGGVQPLGHVSPLIL